MIAVLNVIIYTVVVLISILLVALILVQPAKGGGLGGAFGGVGEGVFGAQTMGHLSKITVVLITLFFILTLLLAVISGHQAKFKNSKGSLITSSETVVEESVSETVTEEAAGNPASGAVSVESGNVSGTMTEEENPSGGLN